MTQDASNTPRSGIGHKSDVPASPEVLSEFSEKSLGNTSGQSPVFSDSSGESWSRVKSHFVLYSVKKQSGSIQSDNSEGLPIQLFVNKESGELKLFPLTLSVAPF